jgi:hypothetical protein
MFTKAKDFILAILNSNIKIQINLLLLQVKQWLDSGLRNKRLLTKSVRHKAIVSFDRASVTEADAFV